MPDTRPGEALAQLAWLRGPEGAAPTALAGRLLAEGTDLLPGLARLRSEVGAEHAGPAWELARLRARARPVFGADADVLFLTADALEQAGRPELAARRAARLLAGGATQAADLGCAAGTDTVALARARRRASSHAGPACSAPTSARSRASPGSRSEPSASSRPASVVAAAPSGPRSHANWARASWGRVSGTTESLPDSRCHSRRGPG